MDLTSGCPFWPVKDGLVATYPALEQSVECDVAVLGGGITGACVGHALAGAGVDVVLLDKRDAGTGSTAACTGLIQYEVDVHLHDLAERIGTEKAQRSYQLCLEANRGLADLVRRLGDDCGYAQRPSLYLASRQRDVASLRKEYAARRACGIELEFLDQRAIRARFGLEAPAALLSPEAGEIDAYRLTHALLTRARRDGLRAFDRTRVTRIEHRRKRVVLQTDRGPRVSARSLVLAAGYEMSPFFRDARIKLRTTYALATEPVKSFDGWRDRCLIWETRRPYFYARTTSDQRVLLGGGDDAFTRPDAHVKLLPRKTGALTRRFMKMFPRIVVEPAFRWAGVFAETDDGLPFIAACGKMPGTFIAAGYGGNGITYSFLAGQILRDLLLGHPNRDADLFRFDR